MNKFLFFPIFFTFFHGQVSAGNGLDVEFSGELVSTACRISSDSLNKKVTLYNLRWQSINKDVYSEITSFDIEIDNCSQSDLNKSIKMSWISSQLISIDGNKFLTTQGDSNVLLGLSDKEGTPVDWNEPVNIGNVSNAGTSQRFTFGVYVRKPVSGDANVGDFSGVATFSLDYE